MRRWWLALALALALPACGNDPGEPEATRDVVADDDFFEPARVRAPAGPVEFRVVNEGETPHTFVIGGVGFKLRVFETGTQRTGVAELDPGEYVFYCDIEGHREDGMEGVLIVRG